MSKTDPNQGHAGPPGTLNADGTALVTALTQAILAAQSKAPGPAIKASEAVEQYALIKAALKTRLEAEAERRTTHARKVGE